MKTRKIFVFIAVVFAVLAMANFAFAVNRVEVKATSESIRYHASCDKGGGFSLQFDELTTLTHGDQITVDLPFTPPSSQVTLCRNIDLVIAPVSTWMYYSATGAWSTGVAPAVPNASGWGSVVPPTANSPVIYSTIVPTTADSGVIFHVYGTSGQDRITIDVIGADWLDADGDLVPDASSNSGTLTVGVGGTLSLNFLDQQTNAINFTTQTGIWTDSTTTDTYLDAATSSDNTLCINVSTWEGSTVDVHMDSKLDKFSFIPTDPPIAHITGGDISRYICSKEACAIIKRSTLQASCEFDNDNGTGFCLDKINRLIIQTAGTFDPNTTYQITASILVNGSYSDAQGVYFSSGGVTASAYQTGTDACANSTPYQVTPPITYYTALGAVATPLVSNPNCLISGTTRATRLITTSTALFDSAVYRYLYINLPTFFYDSTVMNDGDLVELEYAITKAPCGELIRETICIGTFNSSCTGTTSTSLLYPYFTPMNDDPANDDYWDGIVITNLGTSAGTATLTIYEQDGDVGTMTTSSIAANSMYVNLLWSMYGGMTKISGSGTLGDSRCYIVVCTDFLSHGFAMVGNQATGESMGYLPDKTLTDLCP